MNNQNQNQNSNDDIFEALSKDRQVRQAITKESHLLFFSTYFPHYLEYPMAEFQKDIFRITEDQTNKLACIVAFRGSGKSTIVTFSYAIWSILGVQEKKFVLIICATQALARQHMTNLKDELDHNELLKSDLGPFHEDNGGNWAISSIVFENTGARIMIASVDQAIRGVRHHENRPDLTILDDVEDMNSTRTLDGRNKIFDWFTREIVPLGDLGTRIIIVGNLLHEDSLVMRLKKKIDAKELDGIYRYFPLLDENNVCLWPRKFDTPEKIEGLRRSVANELAWQQEYLLKIISDTTRVVYPEWIHTYTDLPADIRTNARGVFIGVDLAISEEKKADYTAIVTGVLYGFGENERLYILPNPINKRIDYPEVVDTVAQLVKSLPFERQPVIFVESNGFQRIYSDLMRKANLKAVSVKNTADKRLRVAMTGYKIKDGVILFPASGAELLIDHLTGFGIEGHDDLPDAFATLVNEYQSANQQNGWISIMEEYLAKQKVDPNYFNKPHSMNNWVNMAHAQSGL